MPVLINIGIGAPCASTSLNFRTILFYMCIHFVLYFLLLDANRYAAYVFSGYKSNLNWKCNAVMKYSNPCKGCSYCYSKELSYNQSTNLNRRWWHAFLPKKQTLVPGKMILIKL